MGQDSTLRHMTYRGGSSDAPLTPGQNYDLRFLDDRLMVSLSAPALTVAELNYRDIESVEVSGSERGKSAGETAAVILAMSLTGAVLGVLLRGLPGLLLGALLIGLIGALITASSSKIKTIVQLRGQDAEVFFSTTRKTPEVMRFELSGPLMAIADSRTARQLSSGEPPAKASGSFPDQLSKLASLLADGMLSREEFEHLKAKVIALS